LAANTQLSSLGPTFDDCNIDKSKHSVSAMIPFPGIARMMAPGEEFPHNSRKVYDILFRY